MSNQFGDLVKLLEVVNDMNKRGKATDELLLSLTKEAVTFYNASLSTHRWQQGQQQPQQEQGQPEASEPYPEPLGQNQEPPREEG